MSEPLFFLVYESYFEILLAGDALFDGPWSDDAELASAFVDWAEHALPDVYADTTGSAYEIELLLRDQEPDVLHREMEGFLDQLPPAIARRALERVAETLRDPPPNPEWTQSDREILARTQRAVRDRLARAH